MSIKLLKRLLSQTLDSSLLCRMLLMLRYCLCLRGFHFAVFVAFIVMHLLVCVCVVHLWVLFLRPLLVPWCFSYAFALTSSLTHCSYISSCNSHGMICLFVSGTWYPDLFPGVATQLQIQVMYPAIILPTSVLYLHPFISFRLYSKTLWFYEVHHFVSYSTAC